MHSEHAVEYTWDFLFCVEVLEIAVSKPIGRIQRVDIGECLGCDALV